MSFLLNCDLFILYSWYLTESGLESTFIKMFAELNCLKSFKWFLTDYRIKIKLLMMWPLSTCFPLLNTLNYLQIFDYAVCLASMPIWSFHTRCETSHLLILNSRLKWNLLWEIFPNLWRIKCFFLRFFLVSHISLIALDIRVIIVFMFLFPLDNELLKSMGYVFFISGTCKGLISVCLRMNE